MTYSLSLKRLLCMLLALFLLTVPAYAFILGTEEDLEALIPAPENSAPVATPENASPIAQNLSCRTYKNVAFVEKFTAFDPEGDPLRFRLVKTPARGAVTLDETGATFTYTPYENKTGKDRFTFVAEDAYGRVSEPATVSIVIERSKSKVSYADMQGNPAHKDAVRLAEEGVFIGECLGGAYFFRPDTPVSRAEFLTLSMDTLEIDTLDGAITTGFSDDAAIAVWAKPYVASALKSGMITGTPNEEGRIVFAPGAAMTKGEATVLLSRLLELTDVPTSAALNEAAPVWAAQSASNLEAVGVLGSLDGLEATLTKADAAQMLSAALEVLEFREDAGRFHLF